MLRLLLLTGFLAADLSALDHHPPKGYEPQGMLLRFPNHLTTTLEAPATPILLGAGWVVHYVIHNGGGSAVDWFPGGGVDRRLPTPVWLEALGPDQAPAEDPHRHDDLPLDNGVRGGRIIPPWGTAVLTVDPQDFVRFDRPGRWTLRMFHDLGMGPAYGDQDPRWATATVDVLMPDATQAAAVVAEHESRIAARWTMLGERGVAHADFAAMRLPVYLPLLEARALAGSRLALDGLEAMPTGEAIDSLLRVLTAAPGPLPPAEEAWGARAHPWSRALRALARRRPPTDEEVKLGMGGDPRLQATMDAARLERATRAALALLHHQQLELRQSALAFLRRGPLDPQLLVPLIEAAVRMPANESELSELLAIIRAQSRPPPDPRTSAAAAMLWLDHLLYHRAERPPGWQETLGGLLLHPAPRIREWAVLCVPQDDIARWTPVVATLMQDDDQYVRSRAVGVASGLGPQMIPHLRAAIVRGNDPEWIAQTIGRLAGRQIQALAWTDRLAESLEAFADSNSLHGFFRTLGPYDLRSTHPVEEPLPPAERRATAERLRAFVASHGEAIDRSALGPPDDSWPRDLLPEGWSIVGADRTSWPP
jgi:hypothetical protein